MPKVNMPKRPIAVFLAICLAPAFLAGCQNKEGSALEKGMSLVEQGKYEQSFESFEKAIKDGKDVRLAYRGEGIAYMGMEDYEDAVEAFDEALAAEKKIDDDTASDIAFYKASAQMKLGDYEGAVETYSDIPDFDKNPEAEYLRGVACLQAGEKELALADFEDAVNNDKKNYELYLNIYQSLKEHGFTEDGKKYLDTVLEKSTGKRYKDKLLRGEACYYMEEYDEALELFESCAGDKDDRAEVYNWLGMCKIQLNDETALDDIEKGIALNDQSVMQQLLFNEIAACEKMGDFAKAKEKMESYLKKYPDDGDAQREYEFLKTR